jgi:hypothetical protein
MDMVVHRFNDRIREDLARIALDKRRSDETGPVEPSATGNGEPPPGSAGDPHLAPV